MISSVRHRNDAAGHDLARRDYWRDNRDRIVAWKRGADDNLNQMEDGRGNRYGYDAEGQLTAATYRATDPETDHPGPGVRMDSFQYDEMGNRKGLNHVASRGAWMTVQRRDNGLNQYASWENDIPAPNPGHWGSGIFYDDNITEPPPDPSSSPWPWIYPGNGVLMQDGYITAGFNALNQPTGIWSKVYQGTSNWMWFGFDPLGRCVKRWKGPPGDPNPVATYFYYDGTNLIQETNAATGDRLYVQGGRVDEIVASQVGGVWYHHHYDAQGNCILQSNASGFVQVQCDYDAFGFPYFYNASGGKGVAQTRFLFTGREWLSDLRLYDYRARMYQPELGRFLQPDPKQFEAGDYNLYRYCHNDPINKSDPTGMDGLLMTGKGDWDWFNGEVAFAQLNLQAKKKAKDQASSGEKRELMPMPSEMTSRMWSDQQKNAEQANDKKNWTPMPGNKYRPEEYATGGYRKGEGFVTDGPNRGYHQGDTPKSDVFRKEYKGGGTRAFGTHIHVTGNGRHLLEDRDQAVRYRFISGTGHVSHPERLEIFRPYKSGEGGQYYHTNDGENVIPGRLPW